VRPFGTRILDAGTAVWPTPARGGPKLARVTYCTCPAGPWCRGQASADWAACQTSCHACRPPLFMAPARTPALAAREHLRGERA
jgi:hypothetical protein